MYISNHQGICHRLSLGLYICVLRVFFIPTRDAVFQCVCVMCCVVDLCGADRSFVSLTVVSLLIQMHSLVIIIVYVKEAANYVLLMSFDYMHLGQTSEVSLP